MAIKGKAFKYGNDVNTDVIFPGKYTYTISDPAEMAQHAMEDLDPGFAAAVRPGDMVVAGSNFGCGSSREQAATCLKASGVSVVVAKSFARIYFRNALNSGLLVVICPEAVDAIVGGEELEVDFEAGLLRCAAGEFRFPPLPDEVMGIVRAGGLIPFTRQRLGLA